MNIDSGDRFPTFPTLMNLFEKNQLSCVFFMISPVVFYIE